MKEERKERKKRKQTKKISRFPKKPEILVGGEKEALEKRKVNFDLAAVEFCDGSVNLFFLFPQCSLNHSSTESLKNKIIWFMI